MALETTTSILRRTWLLVAAATGVLGLSLGRIWWLAWPRAGVCLAIRPAPPGCELVDRVPVAVAWTVVLVVSSVAVLWVARSRPSRPRWASWTALALLVALGLIASEATRLA
ncbi:hypothetical protein [Oerskovia enterophila]|uniref:Vitamin K epoxide reductase family protein n=1 Tax=Oerskovia enterophila TaxID=43678 RepID=A0ABX2XYY9_9CELL|nr:hypothetical protein [Oerskovia enterophila]OCI29524.1 hypothetical protein OERS_37740 [Oerskovia enterophila]